MVITVGHLVCLLFVYIVCLLFCLYVFSIRYVHDCWPSCMFINGLLFVYVYLVFGMVITLGHLVCLLFGYIVYVYCWFTCV